MTDSQAPAKRPAGLTALAVFNFIFAARALLILPVVFSPSSLRAMSARFDAPLGLVAASLAVGGVTHALGALVGVGYLGQRRNLGRILGNVYALLGFVSTLLAYAVVPKPVALGGIIYPVITLALINGRYRRNLVT